MTRRDSTEEAQDLTQARTRKNLSFIASYHVDIGPWFIKQVIGQGLGDEQDRKPTDSLYRCPAFDWLKFSDCGLCTLVARCAGSHRRAWASMSMSSKWRLRRRETILEGRDRGDLVCVYLMRCGITLHLHLLPDAEGHCDHGLRSVIAPRTLESQCLISVPLCAHCCVKNLKQRFAHCEMMVPQCRAAKPLLEASTTVRWEICSRLST